MTVQTAVVVQGHQPMPPIAKVPGGQPQKNQQEKQQQQRPQRVAVLEAATTTSMTIVPAVDIYSKRQQRRSALTLDDVSTAVAAPARSALLINPWRELDREDFVIAYAMKGTARCIACNSKIAKGELQLGAFYLHGDKFTLVRWYHQRCVVAPECLRNPMDLCGIEDLQGDDLDRVLKWLGYGVGSVKDRSWTA